MIIKTCMTLLEGSDSLNSEVVIDPGNGILPCSPQKRAFNVCGWSCLASTPLLHRALSGTYLNHNPVAKMGLEAIVPRNGRSISSPPTGRVGSVLQYLT